jgi:hypothetical protein
MYAFASFFVRYQKLVPIPLLFTSAITLFVPLHLKYDGYGLPTKLKPDVEVEPVRVRLEVVISPALVVPVKSTVPVVPCPETAVCI